jgi:hemerythrin
MFEWKPQYSVNIGSIDGQHQNPFRIAEELPRAIAAGQGKAAAVHFVHEQRLMSLHCYPDPVAHVRNIALSPNKCCPFRQISAVAKR